MTKKELEDRVAELEQALAQLGEGVVVQNDDYVKDLERLLTECEEAIPAFFYGNGWKNSLRVKT